MGAEWTLETMAARFIICCDITAWGTDDEDSPAPMVRITWPTAMGARNSVWTKCGTPTTRWTSVWIRSSASLTSVPRNVSSAVFSSSTLSV